MYQIWLTWFLCTVSSMRSAFTCAVRRYCHQTARFLSVFVKLPAVTEIPVGSPVTSAFQVGTHFPLFWEFCVTPEKS